MAAGTITRRKGLMTTETYVVTVIAANTNLTNRRVYKGEGYKSQIIADSGYSIYEIKITMGGLDITSSVYDATYQMIDIPHVTDAVTVEVYAMHSIPSDYIRVDGIKNPSNAWMDTDYKFTNSTGSIEIDVTIGSRGIIAADRALGNTNNYGVGFVVSDGGLRAYRNKSVVFLESFVANQRKILKQDLTNQKLYIEGISRNWARDSGTSGARTLGLFGVSVISGGSDNTYDICHSLKIYETTSYVRYYIPCLNDSGVAGFWDAARGVFQGSSNSTAFEAVAADGGDFRLINFEDNAVKNICVTNWGGHYKDGEMYTPEARAVTTLSNKFENNANIVKFNELQYFTGLTTLSRYVSSQYLDGMHFFGAFNRCSNLEEITLPTISITGDNCIAALFLRCPKLKTVDMSPITVRSITYLYGICRGNTAMTSVILPNVSTTSSYLATMYAFNNCSNLTTIDASRVNFAYQNHSNDANSFSGCTKLTRIIGGLSGFRQTETTIKDAPLTHDAAVELLESLGTVTAARTLKLKTSTYNTLTAEEKAIATDKGWTLNYG